MRMLHTPDLKCDFEEGETKLLAFQSPSLNKGPFYWRKMSWHLLKTFFIGREIWRVDVVSEMLFYKLSSCLFYFCSVHSVQQTFLWHQLPPQALLH